MNDTVRQPAGQPTGGQFAAPNRPESAVTLTDTAVLASGVAAGLLRQRSDGRHEVADTATADQGFGCEADDWCILANGHNGDCAEDREVWAGADRSYTAPADPDRAA